MTVVFKMLANIGFVAGDTATGRTAFAYPTSPHATSARRHPLRVATEMMKQANAFTSPYSTSEYDANNWRLLNTPEY